MNKTILAVDDSASMRGMIAFTLKTAGYQVLEAADGQAALATLATQPVHFVITDLNMPQVDGISLIRQIRAQPQYKYVPIVMLTTESQEEKKQAARAAGASGWITKPFRSDQIVAVAKKFLG